MNRRRALMVFSGAFEFKRDNNKEIKEREDDEVELPKLAKQIEEHERNISKPPTDQVKTDRTKKIRFSQIYFLVKVNLEMPLLTWKRLY